MQTGGKEPKDVLRTIAKKRLALNEYEKLIAVLMPLERWQRIAFSAACAERVSLIFRSFGSPESQELYEQGLKLVWCAIKKEDLAPQAKQLIKKIDNATEAEEVVPDLTDFAKRALNILAYALEAVARNEIEPAEWTCAVALEFRGELDHLLSEDSQRIKLYPPGETPPSGPLLVREFKHQRRTLELIKSVRKPDAELVGLLRHLSQDANKELEFAVSEIRNGRR